MTITTDILLNCGNFAQRDIIQSNTVCAASVKSSPNFFSRMEFDLNLALAISWFWSANKESKTLISAVGSRPSLMLLGVSRKLSSALALSSMLALLQQE